MNDAGQGLDIGRKSLGAPELPFRAGCEVVRPVRGPKLEARGTAGRLAIRGATWRERIGITGKIDFDTSKLLIQDDLRQLAYR